RGPETGGVKSARCGRVAGGGAARGAALSLGLDQRGARRGNASGARARAAMIVVLTDGASNEGVNPLSVVQQIAPSKVPVQTIGIGLRDSSAVVGGERVGGVDEATLKAISAATGGKYYYAQAAGELQNIHRAL